MAILRAAAAILLVRDDRDGQRIVGEPRVRRAGHDCGEDRPHLGVNGGIFRSAGIAELYELHIIWPIGRGSPNIRAQVPEKQRSIPDDNWDSHVCAPVNG